MQDGSVNIFTWDYWAGPSDRILGHPSSVDSMGVLNASTIATGGGDGFLRYVHIKPNSLLGWTVIPHHLEEPDGDVDKNDAHHPRSSKSDEENQDQEQGEFWSLRQLDNSNLRSLRLASSSPLDVVSNDNFWPISTLSILPNGANGDGGAVPLLICGSQEMVYVTADHLKYLPKPRKISHNFASSSDGDEGPLDIGSTSDYQPSSLAVAKEDRKRIPRKKKTSKMQRTTKGTSFVGKREAENAAFFHDLLEHGHSTNDSEHDHEKELDLERL